MQQQTVVTKAEYAGMKQRAPSAISNWIAEGKISQAALIGEGVRARIWVEQAEQDLARSLDEGQQTAQAVPANSTSTSPVAGQAPEPEDDFLKRRRAADADRAEHEAELAELKLQRETGRWIEAHKAQQEWGRELSAIVGEIDTFIMRTLAREIADQFGLDYKTVAVMAKEKWHERRRTLASNARMKIAADDDAPEDEPPNGTAG